MVANEIEQLREAIAVLEAQRAVLGDAVVETALAPLREKLIALTRAAPSADERKRVTVLFSDLAGFTATSEKMDPEDVHTLMNAYFGHVTPAITRFGGTVEKYVGDAVMALFGAPKALENHEEMAVRAALAMQEALEAFNEQLEQEQGLRLTMRIGVNTGLVLFGSMGGRADEDFAAVGDTINLTSRLQSACPVGRVMVSAETARPLHAIFDFELPQQITAKGKSEPITVYVVVGEKAQRGRVRGLAGLHAPMVGRDTELRVLQSAFEDALAGQRWQMAAVLGEAGIGKTRLQDEFVTWVTQVHPEARLLIGRSYAHTQGTPYSVLADLVRALLGIGADDASSLAVNWLAERLHELDPTAEETELGYRIGSLAGVLGFPLADDPLQSLDPEQRRDRTFLSLERLLLAAAANAPLVVVVDDLQWADVLSLSFIRRLVQVAAGNLFDRRAALLLTFGRPAEDSDSPLARLQQQLAQPPHLTIRLAPLEAEESDTLVAELLGEVDLPPDILSLVLQRAQGNPFFVEEILRSLIEEGTLAQDPATGSWRATQEIDKVAVPATVQGVLAARLDGLPDEERYVVRHAAIVGRVFWQQLLAEVIGMHGGTDPAGEIESMLVRLEARQFVARMGETQIAGDWEWLFRHLLTQEVAYASVTKATRRRVHDQVARWLEARVGSTAGSFVPLIADHCERGGVLEKAVEYLRRAGEQAAAQFANAEAVDYFSRALGLLPQVDQEPARQRRQRYDLLLARAAVYRLTGERDAQSADLAELKLLAEEMDDTGRRAEVSRQEAAYYEAVSDFPAALTAAQEAVEWARQASDPHQQIEAWIDWGIALWRQGNFQDARQPLEEALALAQQHDDRPGQAASLHNLGTVSYFQNDYQAARDRLEEALQIRRDLDDRRGQALSLSNLVGIHYGMGDLARAKACSEEALAIYQTIGNRRGETQVLSNLASLRQALGDLATARQDNERALALFQTLGEPRGEALAANNLGLVLHELGDDRAARDHCERALAINRAIGDRNGEGYSLTYLAMALEGLGDMAAAAKVYLSALDLRRDMGQPASAVDDLAGLARVALKQGRLAEALAHAEEALEWIASHGVDGIEYPLRVYMTAADVLTAAGREQQASEALAAAHTLLHDRAARISDESLRRAFLEDVPLNRQLCERLDHQR